MYLAVEKEIQSALLKGASYQEIAKSLLKKSRFLKSTDAFLHVCCFLYQAGFYNLIIEIAISRLSKNKVVPWAVVIAVLSLHKIKIPAAVKKAFMSGIIKQDQVVSMLGSGSWDAGLPKLARLKAEKVDQIYREKNQKFVQLMEDLQFIQAQGFSEKEKEVLNELKQIEPDNPFIHEQWVQMKEKSARVLLHKRQYSTPHQQLPVSRIDAQESQQIQKIVESVKHLMSEQPEKAYDMALFFLFIGHPQWAVSFLKDHLNSFSAEWLYVDLLIQSELYLDCLSFLDKLEAKYADNPEMPFSLAYIRAKAYYGLGQKNRAKNILSDLLAVRPKYRLAQFLLRQWSNEEKLS